MVPENQPLGPRSRLSRELGLAEKRLECYSPCSEWGQPDNTMPRLCLAAATAGLWANFLPL